MAFDASESDDSEDDLPLSELAKRRRVGANTLTVKKNNQYKWGDVHAPNEMSQWQNVQGPKNLQSPMKYFESMVTNEVIELLVHFTNLYAAQKNVVANVSAAEMRCFLGVLLYSGYAVVPRRYMYWEKSTDTTFELVANALSRNRFTLIMTHIHFCDNTIIRTANDKFAKLRPLFQALNKNFSEMAPFEENYSIDEAMVPYYGGHSCKQFIRGKPIRWGYKLWVGATRLGYVMWFDPYQGNSSNIPECYKELGLGASVILKFADVLQSCYPNTPFHLFFDNFFTSIPLIHELTNRGLKATGTIRENRTSKCPLPPKKDFKKTDRGTFAHKSSEPKQILVCKWNDNSVVTVASNSGTIEPLHNAKRFSQALKKYIHLEQPDLIKTYNENMGGVDRSDQNIGLYRTSIRGKKWYFSLFCHCLDMALHNAWHLYKNDGGEYDHLAYRRTIARGLLETYKRQEKRGPSRMPRNHHEHSRYDRTDHFIEYMDLQSRCTLCKKKKQTFGVVNVVSSCIQKCVLLVIIQLISVALLLLFLRQRLLNIIIFLSE